MSVILNFLNAENLENVSSEVGHQTPEAEYGGLPQNCRSWNRLAVFRVPTAATPLVADTGHIYQRACELEYGRVLPFRGINNAGVR